MGESGSPGISGITGATGRTGEIGDNGTTGSNGASGRTGITLQKQIHNEAKLERWKLQNYLLTNGLKICIYDVTINLLVFYWNILRNTN